MSVFEAGDIVEVAVRIEENGAGFYRYAVQLAGNEETKLLFQHLAEEEVGHQRTFERILAGLKQSPPPEGYDGEYAAYLHNYVDNRLVFTKDQLTGEMARMRSEADALDFAIQRELDSIHYYREVQELLPEDQRPVIGQIIAEEKGHFKRLSEMRERLGR